MPDTASQGSAVALTVNGSNFASNAVVKWNGGAQPTKFVSANQLTAAIAATTLNMSATVQITVTNPGTTSMQYGGGTLSETSNAMDFTVK